LECPAGDLSWVDAGLGERTCEELFKSDEPMTGIEEHYGKDFLVQPTQAVDQKATGVF
jgi:hypothetical protein